MSGKPNAAGIGQDRGIQNPADTAGVYADPVDKMPEDEKLPLNQMPMAPNPVPFTITGGGSGKR